MSVLIDYFSFIATIYKRPKVKVLTMKM